MTLRALFIILAVCWPSVSLSASLFPDDYDKEFKSAMVFLPVGTDWRLLKAQCYQESRLDPFARSPVGAMGLCQFMPGTWKEAQRAIPGIGSAWLPEASIRAAGWYMGRLHRIWSAKREPMDRYMLAAASYNAGAGHLIKAQRLCGGAAEYAAISPCLVIVTGHHSKETLGYVRNIVGRWWPAMLFE